MSSHVSNTPARTGVWVGIGAISMSFAAYTSALVVRAGDSPDWTRVHLPAILYANTLILLASSITFEIGRRRLAGPYEARASGLSYLHVTLALGVLFLAGQVTAWRTLAGQGLFLATNPNSSFFYVLTAVHALHLIGGLAGLAYVVRRARVSALPSPGPVSAGTLSAVALYWHFMDVLWLYLLVVLTVWL
jgi:cytochrome c oxidase subunit III